jgi:hypothetical protein
MDSHPSYLIPIVNSYIFESVKKSKKLKSIYTYLGVGLNTEKGHNVI